MPCYRFTIRTHLGHQSWDAHDSDNSSSGLVIGKAEVTQLSRLADYSEIARQARERIVTTFSNMIVSMCYMSI